ncbi:MAG: DUF4437 domain-containing protein [Hyphomicrobiales bacterium]
MLKRFTFNLFAAASVVLATTSAQAIGSDKIINLPLPNMAWEQTPEGVEFAPLDGDRFDEAYMAMVRLPAGLVSPPHIKSANMFGIVVSGTMLHLAQNTNDAAPETPLPEGSFYKIPAGLPHVSKCISSKDCVTFLYQDGQFDFLPVNK